MMVFISSEIRSVQRTDKKGRPKRKLKKIVLKKGGIKDDG